MGRGSVATVVTLVATAALVGPSAPGIAATPKDWDERVLPYVRFVEQERGLQFDHPVPVRFLQGEAFNRALLAGDEPTPEDIELDAQLAGQLVALGLASERYDSGEVTEADAEGTVGFYDTEKEEMVVRGSSLDTVDGRVTLVHELTHALQDQHFDLDALDEETATDSEYSTLSYLVEGDATAVETAYLDSLPGKERDAYYETGGAGSVETAADDGSGDSPYALEVLALAPYVLGEAYVAALDADRGLKSRNEAFRAPPRTEELLIDPVALRTHEPAVPVATPMPLEGERTAYGPEQLGAIGLYFVLGSRIDPEMALRAVTGWGGDSYIGVDRDGVACVRENAVGDTPADTEELRAAISAWQAAMPPGAVEVGSAGDSVSFTACESPDVDEPSVRRLDSVLYNVLGGRVFTILDLRSSGVGLEDARCVADAVSTDPGVIVAYDDSFEEERDLTAKEQRTVDRSYVEAFRSCGVPDPYT